MKGHQENRLEGVRECKEVAEMGAKNIRNREVREWKNEAEIG